MRRVLDQQHFEGGAIQAIVEAIDPETADYVLIRSESTMADFLDPKDAMPLYNELRFETESALRVAFLHTLGSMRRGHESICSGWCGCKLLNTAERVRELLEQTAGNGFPHWHCQEASVALAWALERLGHQPTVLNGDFRLDRELILQADESDEGVLEAAHWWVEVDGFWIDLTADQFSPYVDEWLPPVLLVQAGAPGRYQPLGPAQTSDYAEDRLVQSILAAI